MCITGLMVTQRNWLDVYPYTGWGGNANLPVFEVGQTFTPTALELKQVSAHSMQGRACCAMARLSRFGQFWAMISMHKQLLGTCIMPCSHC